MKSSEEEKTTTGSKRENMNKSLTDIFNQNQGIDTF